MTCTTSMITSGVTVFIYFFNRAYPISEKKLH